MSNMDGSDESAANVIRAHVNDCTSLIEFAQLLTSESSNANPHREMLRKSGIALVRIKSRNRAVFNAVEGKRSVVEKERAKVDRLHLDLENLLYKQAYLQREIRECKDLSTPALDALEAELGSQIGLTEYAAILSEVHSQALVTMTQESEARKDMQAQLLQLNLKYQLAVDKLDKKRKFLDELPTRVSLVKSATNDLTNQFQAFLSSSLAATTVPSSLTATAGPSSAMVLDSDLEAGSLGTVNGQIKSIDMEEGEISSWS